MSAIDEIVSGLSAALEGKNTARDKALADSRRTIRCAANAVRAYHRGQVQIAAGELECGRAMVERTRVDLLEFPDLYWAGYVQDAQKEYAEAELVGAMVAGRRLPGPEEIGVEIAPYLNGLAEAASEMRRYVLDIILRGREQELAQGTRILDLMEDVYTSLITVDFPDAITGGLRRTTDALRAVVERTRGDLALTTRQLELERALKDRS